MLTVDLGPDVVAGFTTREHGVSTGPWEGCNLGLHVGDESTHVERNRSLLADRIGAPVQFLTQVHGTDVHVVDASGPRRPTPAGPVGPRADAIVALGPDVAVGVLVADCAPVLLADPGSGVVAAVHAGRVGLLAGVVERSVEVMIGYGARPGSIRAVIGPAAGSCCYEVPEPMRRDAERRLPGIGGTTRDGTPSLDLAEGCRLALRGAGVGEPSVFHACTIHDERFFSYRRTSVTGRFAGVVRMSA
jgi:YfiH family protein